jgi:hypothetical protein
MKKHVSQIVTLSTLVATLVVASLQAQNAQTNRSQYLPSPPGGPIATNRPPGWTNHPPNHPPGWTNRPPGWGNRPPGWTNRPPNHPPGWTNRPPGWTNRPSSPGWTNRAPGGNNPQIENGTRPNDPTQPGNPNGSVVPDAGGARVLPPNPQPGNPSRPVRPPAPMSPPPK